jgi:hypothetical protein
MGVCGRGQAGMWSCGGVGRDAPPGCAFATWVCKGSNFKGACRRRLGGAHGGKVADVQTERALVQVIGLAVVSLNDEEGGG